MIYLLICVIILLDQLFKYFISIHIEIGEVVPVIDHFFYLTHQKNAGAAFSLFSNYSWGIYVLTAFSIIVMIVLLFFLITKRKKTLFLLQLDVAVLVSGSIGNLIDRIRLKSVTDYLLFKFGEYVFPIFNLADICIVISSIGLVLLIIFKEDLFTPDSKSEKIEDESRDQEQEETL